MLLKLTRIGLIVIVIALLSGNSAVGINANPVSGIGSISAGPAQNAPGTPSPNPQTAPTYLFVLDNCLVDNTRSTSSDNDFVGFGVSVNDQSGVSANNQIVSVTHKYLGSVGDNDQPQIDLEIGPLPIPDNQNIPVRIVYLIINLGNYNPTTTPSIYSNIDDGTRYFLHSYGPRYGSTLPFVDKYLGYLENSFCDGTVAAAYTITNGNELTRTAPGSSYSQSDNMPGTDSNVGCGSNSVYHVNWHVKRLS